VAGETEVDVDGRASLLAPARHRAEAAVRGVERLVVGQVNGIGGDIEPVGARIRRKDDLPRWRCQGPDRERPLEGEAAEQRGVVSLGVGGVDLIDP
jgi:hypothetical protein